MENVFKYFNGFFKGLTGLVMTILGLAIAVSFLMGTKGFFDYDVIANITGIIKSLAGQGLVGLIGLLIIWSLISGK